MDMIMKENKLEQLTYEQAFGELETIIESLETGQTTLDESLKLYERGQLLLTHCSSILERAEVKIRTLSGNNPENLSGLA